MVRLPRRNLVWRTPDDRVEEVVRWDFRERVELARREVEARCSLNRNYLVKRDAGDSEKVLFFDGQRPVRPHLVTHRLDQGRNTGTQRREIGRASCRERVCQYV